MVQKVIHLALLGVLLVGVVSADAAEPCGDIVYPAGYYTEDSDEERDVISDCGNPFQSSGTVEGLYVAGQEVVSGMVIESETPVSDYGFAGEGYFNDVSDAAYYRHDDGDLVAMDVSFLPPTRGEYEAAVAAYLGESATSERVAFYTQLFFEDDTYQYFFNDDGMVLDDVTGNSVVGTHGELIDYMTEHVVTPRRPLEYGTYTAVQFDSGGAIGLGYADTSPGVTGVGLSWWQSVTKEIGALLLPTAYAAAGNRTITFTIAPPATTTPVVGASSVLFLPGIQASRLYTEGLFGTEDQLWEPNINNDVAQLEMTEEGVSVRDIYTRDVVDEIFGMPNVYRGFLDLLQDMKDDALINGYAPFAYDWRYSVTDIVRDGTKYEDGYKNIIDEIEALAAESYTGKVTIVAHSNGGLLAKAAMIELEKQQLNHLVDKVVLLASPQLGTPKAIAAILHGFGQQAAGGLIIDDETARDVIRNMPGTYALLPSEAYFDAVGEIVISNDDSVSARYLDAYDDVDTFSEFESFVFDVSQVFPEQSSIHEPIATNHEMVQSAIDLHRELDSWVAPSTTEVYEIVGVGIPTVKAFHYQEVPCSVVSVSDGCIFGVYSKPFPVMTTYGDETVVATSAAGYRGDKFVAEIDLYAEGDGVLSREYKHVNVSESPTVQEFIASIIAYRYLSDTLEIPEHYTTLAHQYQVIGVHSPVDIVVRSGNGATGSSGGEVLQEIYGSQYFRLGGSSYVVVPFGTEYEVLLQGYATGTYSVTIDTLQGNVQTPLIRYYGASTTPSMQAQFTVLDGDISSMYIDSDGNEVYEQVVNLAAGTSTQLMTSPPESMGIKGGKGSTKTNRHLPQGIVAGVTITADEQYLFLLKNLVFLLESYLQLIKNSYDK